MAHADGHSKVQTMANRRTPPGDGRHLWGEAIQPRLIQLVTSDTVYRMSYTPLPAQVRASRRQMGLTQAALATRSGTSRVTIARLESGAAQDFRVGTLSRLCKALGLELSARPTADVQPALETLLARAQDRVQRLDRRRRHAVLAARLLAAPAPKAAALVAQARARVDRWERERLCSNHYVARWRAMLTEPVRHVARTLLETNGWTDALLQNSPWSFAHDPPA
jgi:transcriptional regulator with XRE-family HTH domain